MNWILTTTYHSILSNMTQGHSFLEESVILN